MDKIFQKCWKISKIIIRSVDVVPAWRILQEDAPANNVGAFFIRESEINLFMKLEEEQKLRMLIEEL